MQIYCVGGAVRDELLGRKVVDRDFVVVGTTPEEMTRLGYRPVGKDFPVFLHPETHEEYALARTERKIALGYKGFQVYAAPNVTLEEDLLRRDLTINAMAKSPDGKLIDPFNGKADLCAGILRHVSPAFAEDPVRILRVARFAARFGFSVAPETLALMRHMVENGEVAALVAERVWQELARGLDESRPSLMFGVLRDCAALAHILPEVDCLFGVPQPPQHHPEIDTGIHVMMVVDYAAAQGYSLPVRFAALTHDLGKGTTPREEWPRHIAHEARSVALVKALCQRIKIPAECRDLALLAARYHTDVHRACELKPETIVKLFEAADAFRRPQRFVELLQACAADFHGRTGYAEKDYPQMPYLDAALNAANSINAGAVAALHDSDPGAIPDAIRQARITAVKAWLPR